VLPTAELEASVAGQYDAAAVDPVSSTTHANFSVGRLPRAGFTPQLTGYLDDMIHAVQSTHVERASIAIDR
jgi:hypothetical protein